MHSLAVGTSPLALWAVYPVTALLAAACTRVALRYVSSEVIAGTILLLIIIGFLFSGLRTAERPAFLYEVEPPAEAYEFDPVLFVKTFYLFDSGQGFYEAYAEAFRQDKRFDQPPASLAAWRSPTVTAVWSAAFDSGRGIVAAYVVLSALSLGGLYLIARRVSDPVSALVAPALAFAYYLSALTSDMFTEYEFWAGFAAILSAVLVFWRREKLGIASAVLAGAMREWFISAAIAGAVQRLATRKWKKSLPWLAASAAVLALYAANTALVARHLRSEGIRPTLGAERLSGGGPLFILYTLRFSGGWYTHAYAVPYLTFGLSLAGAVYLLLKRNYYVPTLMFVPLAAFLVVGSGQRPGGQMCWNDYYGAAFMPFCFVLTACAWKLVEWRRSSRAEVDMERAA
jgi:hypothetical protein